MEWGILTCTSPSALAEGRVNGEGTEVDSLLSALGEKMEWVHSPGRGKGNGKEIHHAHPPYSPIILDWHALVTLTNHTHTHQSHSLIPLIHINHMCHTL